MGVDHTAMQQTIMDLLRRVEQLERDQEHDGAYLEGLEQRLSDLEHPGQRQRREQQKELEELDRAAEEAPTWPA
jgi:hypothetical protein